MFAIKTAVSSIYREQLDKMWVKRDEVRGEGKGIQGGVEFFSN